MNLNPKSKDGATNIISIVSGVATATSFVNNSVSQNGIPHDAPSWMNLVLGLAVTGVSWYTGKPNN